MKRRWLEIGALVVPVLVGAGWLGVLVVSGGDDGPDPVAVEASGPTFGSLAELVAASDLVVLAEVTAIADGRTITDPADPTAGIRTRLVTVEVVRPLVGDPPVVLVIEEEAELLDGTPILVNGVEPSRQADRGLYFLVAGQVPDAPYHALVNEQGRYLVEGSALRPASDDPLSIQLASMGLDALAAAIAP
jgi:hypothetical protein